MHDREEPDGELREPRREKPDAEELEDDDEKSRIERIECESVPRQGASAGDIPREVVIELRIEREDVAELGFLQLDEEDRARGERREKNRRENRRRANRLFPGNGPVHKPPAPL